MKDAWKEMEKAKEGQFFHKEDKKKISKKQHELELEEFKKHFRNHCPQCGELLNAEQFHNVNISRCGSCRGVWLDDKELNALTSSDNALSWFEKFWQNRKY